MFSGLLTEARAVLPALERLATAPAGEEGVKAVIGRRFILYPQPTRSEAQWAAWWADYFDALADQSLVALEAGMRAWIADPESEFLPKPGRLRELARTAPSRTFGRVGVLRQALRLADQANAPARGPRPDAAEVRAMLEEFRAKAVPSDHLPGVGKMMAGRVRA